MWRASSLQVAGFIFGGNVKQSKISMTSPVQTEHEDGKGEKSEKIAMTTPVATEMSAEGCTTITDACYNGIIKISP